MTITNCNPQRPYVDCHNHIGRTINRLPPTGQTAPLCLARFAETNVRAAISMPTATGSVMVRGLEDIREQNDAIARACRNHPDHFPIGLALAETRLGKLGPEEIDRAMDHSVVVGMVSHPPVREAALPFVEVVAAHNGLCNLHLTDPLMLKIAKNFPQATFLVHAGAYAIENMGSCENVWFEIVQYPDGRGTVWDFKKMANKVGSNRLIFGADLPYYDYRFLIEKIETADIDEELKNKIAYKNCETLIRQYKPNWLRPETSPPSPGTLSVADIWTADPEMPDRLTVYA